MDRFGSSRLRIVWASVCLLLAGLALGAIQGFGADGNSITVFSTPIPLGMDARPIATENLWRLIYTLVPAIILLGGFMPLGDWISNGGRGERYKGLLLGVVFAFLHGLFLSQLMLLPIYAASWKLFGSPFAHVAVQAVITPGEPAPLGAWSNLLRADLNAVVLGLQLLLWTSALGLILKSNRGLAILLAYALVGVGKLMAWVTMAVEFGVELPKYLVSLTTFLGHLLPTESLPGDPLAWSALPLSLGGPLLLAALLILLPAKGGSKAPAKPRKAKA